MTIELTKPTTGVLHEHVSSPWPALPICFDSSSVLSILPAASPLDFVVGINAIAWGLSNEVYPYPRLEEVMTEWANVGHTVPEILTKWRDYGLFGTNIAGWFTLDPHNVDDVLRAISIFGFVLWVGNTYYGPEVKVLCGFHRGLGVNSLKGACGFENLAFWGTEVYVVVPTIYAELDFPAASLIKYETLETK